MLAIEQTPTQEKEISPSMQEVIMQAVKNEFIPNEKPITTDNVLSFVRENFKEDVARKTIHCDLGRLVKKGELSRVTDGVYQVRTEDSFALMIHGDGRNLSMFEKDSVDAVYYDHAWDDGANKDPGARKEDGYRQFKEMAAFPTFKIGQTDFDEIYRVLKQGRFCVMNLPMEGAENQKYLRDIEEFIRKAGQKEVFARIVNLFNKEDSDVILSRYSVEDLPSLERFANNLEETVKMAHEMGDNVTNTDSFLKRVQSKMSGKHFNELTKEYKNQGFEMYAKMTWNKMTAVNQGRQVKDREQLFFITKGRARDDMRPNNKERQKVFGLLDNEIVASRMTPEEFSEISRFVKDFSETKSENRAKKRELLEGLLGEESVFSSYISRMESMILSENNEITDVEKKLFENIRKTAFATMMGASGMLPTEFKIPKPKKGDSDFWGYDTEKPLSLQENVLKFMMMRGETLVEPGTGGGSMMEAAIKNGINYIGFDVSEKAVQTCIERCKLTFTTTEELYASFGVENEVELKETVKTYLQEVSNERKTSYVESLNIREASNYSQEKVDKVVAALKTKGYDISVHEFDKIVTGTNGSRVVIGGDIFRFRKEISDNFPTASYYSDWGCFVINSEKPEESYAKISKMVSEK